jgi:hypothetical protein
LKSCERYVAHPDIKESYVVSLFMVLVFVRGVLNLVERWELIDEDAGTLPDALRTLFACNEIFTKSALQIFVWSGETYRFKFGNNFLSKRVLLWPINAPAVVNTGLYIFVGCSKSSIYVKKVLYALDLLLSSGNYNRNELSLDCCMNVKLRRSRMSEQHFTSGYRVYSQDM